MSKYGKKAMEKVQKTTQEIKEGKSKSGSGKNVTDRKQALAIGLSEARRAGGKVPSKSVNGSKSKTLAGKTSPEKRKSTTTKSKTATSRPAQTRPNTLSAKSSTVRKKATTKK